MQNARQIEAILNRALADYEASSNADTREFHLLKVQVLIFYYDVFTGMLSVFRNNPKGFAQAVALKTLVHSLYEHDLQMSRTLVPRILRYASSRKEPIDTSAIRAAKEKWRAQLARIRAWKDLRNVATGHYGKEIELQIELLKGLSQDEVLSVATAFLDYTHFIILQLLPHRKRGAA